MLLNQACNDDLVYTGSQDDKKIVAVIRAESDSLLKIYLQESQLITEDTFSQPLSDAEIRLYKSEVLQETMKSPASGKVKSTFKVKPNDSLGIAIRKDGYNIVRADVQVPEFVSIILFDTVTRIGNDLLLKMSFIDLASRRNFYMVELFALRWKYILHPLTGARIDSTWEKEELEMESVNRIFFSDQNIVTNQQKFELFNDQIFNGQIFSLDMSINSFNLKESQAKGRAEQLEIRFRNINIDYYNFLTSLSLNRPVYGGPFSITSQVPGNIEGGYGIFAAYSTTTRRIIMK